MPTIIFPTPENKYIFCDRCNTETFHEIRGSSFREFRDDYDYIEGEEYRFYICAGCGSGTLEQIQTNTFNMDKNGEYEYEFTYYPPRTKNCPNFKPIIGHIPLKLNQMYNETVRAYINKTPILCAVGIRSLLEGICADKGIKGRNLEIKINRLIFFLQEKYVQELHSIRFLGNDAAHNLQTPEDEELKLAIEICEHILDYLYELDYKANKLTEMRSNRL